MGRDTAEFKQQPPDGRIDIHSHLLPGIDDGCADLGEVLTCVERLKALGYVGSICTPHILPDTFPHTTAAHIEAHCLRLTDALRNAGVEYRVWPGGELRIRRGVIDWLKSHGVPTLATSRCVLTDFWDHKWNRWLFEAYEWLIQEGYQPIIAHPERLAATKDRDRGLPQLLEMGVWLQGNFRSFTGEEGFDADRLVRRWLAEGKYQFLSLDMHRPNSLESRLDGIQIMRAEFSDDLFDAMTIDAPRRHIFNQSRMPAACGFAKPAIIHS